jgi:transcriptional regulator with XRE-family HTH domain
VPQDPLPDWLREWRWEVGKRIRAEREWANLTQERLAELLEVERTTVVRIELGITSPRLDRLLAIAHALGIEPARLMPGGPERQQQVAEDAEIT